MAESDIYYKLVRGSHSRWEGEVEPDPDPKNPRGTIKRGEHVRYDADGNNSVMKNLTDEEIEALGDRIRVTTAPRQKSAASAAADKKEADDTAAAFSEMNAPEAIAFVEESEDVEALKKLRTAEKSGKGRVTVLKALDEKIADLS